VKTLLHCTAWAETTAELDHRVGRWLRHHQAIPWPATTDMRYGVTGDGIGPEVVWPAGDYEAENLLPHLGRPSHLAYPGWWRSFTYSVVMAEQIGADRIWHVESDFFLASRRMIERLSDVRSGWVAFWCPRHQFAEAAVQVICRDRFNQLHAIRNRLMASNWTCFDNDHAEFVFPFDQVDRSMCGDRFGEAGVDPLAVAGLDFYGQLRGDFGPVFEGAATC
jgi:hypothetical protein